MEAVGNSALPMDQCMSAPLILQPFCHFTYITTHSPTLLSLYLHYSSFSNPSVASPTSQFIPQPFFRFSYVTSCSFNELCSFSNLPVTSPTSQLILQPFRRFTYVTTHSQTLPLLQLRHSSLPNPSFASPTSQALHLMSSTHSPTYPSLHLRHNSFSNPSVALPTSQLILQPFRCFTYVTVHSPTLLSLLLRHKLFI